jgi:hypothetical protein
VTEAEIVHKRAGGAKSLRELAGPCLSRSLARQGFAATEVVTRWPEIAGNEIAAHAQPIKIRWSRSAGADEPGTLVLRVDGPIAIEIQHLTDVILERVNRFFGWRAIGTVALRQAPFAPRRGTSIPAPPDANACARIAATLTGIAGDELRQALGRLGAAIHATLPAEQ